MVCSWERASGAGTAAIGERGDDQDGPDMQTDSHQILSNVAEGQLLEHIERAQQIMFHESEIQQ
jgi:hypothetical protein